MIGLLIGLFVGVVIGVSVGIALTGKLCNDIIKDEERKIDRLNKYYDLLNKWIEISQDKSDFSSYFNRNGYNNVAVYGMGELGLRFVAELSGTNINIICGIDKNPSKDICDFPIYKVDEIEWTSLNIDVVVVSAVFNFYEIEEFLKRHLTCDIVSLEDVVKQL